MRVDFMKTPSPNNKLEKSTTILKSSDCTLLRECTVETPVLLVSKDVDLSKCNYFYIPFLNRYYFVTSISLLPDGNFNITGRVDVLMSNKDKIKNLYCLIKRNEFLFSPYMVDSRIVPRTERNIVTKNVGTFGDTHSYYVTVVNDGRAGD